MSLNAKPMFPATLFEDHKSVPNLIIYINSSRNNGDSFDSVALNPGSPNDLASLDPRYFLPLANNAALFRIRNIMLCGANPAVYPDLEYALKCFAGRAEHLCLAIHPGQSSGIDRKLISFINEVVYIIPAAVREGCSDYFQTLKSMAEEVSDLRDKKPGLPIQAMLCLSAANLSHFDQIIDLIEKDGFDRLHFFPANLYLEPGKGRRPEPIDPEQIPSRENIKDLERKFWDLLEERCFETRLFDLNICRRQLERILEYFKAVHNMGEFSPPYCRASRISFFIESKGLVRCCPYQKVTGDLSKKSLIEISESEELHIFQVNLNLARSPLCPVCPGVYPHLLWRSR
jgi:hypothetical protein